MHQALDRLAIALDVEQERRRDLVPVPRVVPVILVMAANLAGVEVERDDRAGVEVVARVHVAGPRGGVAGAPVRQVELRIVVPRDPHRPAAGLPRVTAPGLAAWLAGGGDRVGPPDLLAGLGVERRDECAHAELTARRPDEDFALRHQGRHRRVVALLPVVDRLLPHDLSGRRVERDQERVGRGEVHLVLVEPDSATGRVELQELLRQLPLVAPDDVAGLRVQREHLRLRRGDEHHAVVHDRRRLMALRHAGRDVPDGLEALDVAGRDLVERAVAPACVVAAVHEPVLRLRVQEPGVGHRADAHGALRRQHRG